MVLLLWFFFYSHDHLLWLQNTCLQNTHLPYPSGLLHWHWGNHMVAPVPVKQPRRIWVKSLGIKPKQSITRLCIILRMCCMFGPKVGLNVLQQFVSLASVTDHKYATQTAIQKNIHIPSKVDRTNKELMRQHYVDMRAKFWKKLQWNELILKTRVHFIRYYVINTWISILGKIHSYFSTPVILILTKHFILNQEDISIQWCLFTFIGSHKLMHRRYFSLAQSHWGLETFIMGISLPGKTIFILKPGAAIFYLTIIKFTL